MPMFPPHLPHRVRLRLILVAALALATWSGSGVAQTGATARPGEPYYTSNLAFTIPFDPPPQGNIVRIRLYFSTDGGQTWRPGAEARPGEGMFSFRAEREGLYFFATQTQDAAGRFNPVDMSQATPSLKVRIITTNPPIYLQQITPREGCTAAVMWNIPEDVADPNSIQLDCRTVGALTWTPLPEAPRLLNGTYHWNPALPPPLEVRLRVRDRVNHTGEQVLPLQGGGGIRAVGRGPDAALDEVRFVNSQDLSFKYNVEEIGPSGVKEIELWMTEDKETWTKVQTEPNAKAPITYHAAHEGRFGFRLVAVSGVGKAVGRPTRGSLPSFWVEVDTTAPVVELVGTPEVGGTVNARQVTIRWKASDKNLGPNPVKLFYSKDRTGPWTLIAEGRPAEGLHVWQVTTDASRVYIRVEAVDRAGNPGLAETPTEVLIDLAEPKVKIEQVGPAREPPRDMTRGSP